MNFHKIERHLGSLKFAVIIISLFTLFMVVGTFVESYYGTEFANRTVYKKLPFMLIQAMMFLSIVYAVFLRLPGKKRLAGFYTIHAGLVIIGAGSYATYNAGLDGNITLYPNTPTRTVSLNRDQVRIEFVAEERSVTYHLPYTALETKLGDRYDEIELVRYLPFADKVLRWNPSQYSTNESKLYHSGQYLITNDRISQEFTMSLHPEAIDFKSNLTLGPLSIHYLPQSLAYCFDRTDPSDVIFWNLDDQSCFTAIEKKIKEKTTQSGKRFIVLKHQEEFLSFFPDFSPFPMSQDFNIDAKSPIRAISRRLFDEGPNLVILGKHAAYKQEGKWVAQEIPKSGLELPWMGFMLYLNRHQENSYPIHEPVYTLPIQKNNELIRGGMKAIEVSIQGKKFWLTDEKSIKASVNGQQIHLFLEKETLTLPFEFTLDRFKMDHDPGTRNPASYESFVTLFTREGPSKHHVFMNNPLKHAGFTFYQASYFQVDESSEMYGSVLSANRDPGRWPKYLGSLLLVLGSFWHFVLQRKKLPQTEVLS